MGATTSSSSSSSSSKKRHGNWSWNGPPGDHSPFPVDRIPYPGGSDLLYCFVDIMVSHKILKNRINLGPPAVATNVEQFLDRITDCYSQGFTLAKFSRVPGVRMTTELADWSAPQPYQAILSKPAADDADLKDFWELKVEKRILSTRTLSYSDSSAEDDLLPTIQSYADSGARLVCAESIGYVRSETTNSQYSNLGVELFFNVPRQSFKTKYTYHTITLPATYHVVHDVTQLTQKVLCDADFLGQLRLFLNAGWKLIDICLDSSAIAETYRSKVQSKRVETIWIFEKETAKLFDETPVYEGAIIEYLHKVKVSSSVESPCRDWRPVIAGMGVSGWELASIVQTPLLVQSTFTVYTMKLLFIFQRPLAQILARSRFSAGRTHGSGGGGGGGGGGSRAADRGIFDTAVYPSGGRSGSLRNKTGHVTSGGQFYGNSTMSAGPLVNGYVKFASGNSFTPEAPAPPQPQSFPQAPDSLRTYTTRPGTDEDDSQSSVVQAPRSVQLQRARRDHLAAEKPRPTSAAWSTGPTRKVDRATYPTFTSSNDEEGGLDDYNLSSKQSSSISSSTDNGNAAVDFGKLCVFSPVVEIPTS